MANPTKSIVVSNVKETPFGISIGYNKAGTWENFFVNDEKIIPYFKKGAPLTVEYTTNAKGSMVIVGVAPESASAEPGSSPKAHTGASTNRSIELQVCVKAYAELYCVCGATKVIPSPVEFAENVVSLHALVFTDPAQRKLDALKQAAQETLDATEDPDDDIPFG